jgi:hypothetical protein
MAKMKFNAASRLHSVLASLRGAGIRDGTTIQAWARVFGVKVPTVGTIGDSTIDAYRTLLQGLADVADAYSETLARLHAIEDLDRETFLAPLPAVTQLIAPENLNRAWNDTLPLLPDTAMLALRFAADKLAQAPSRELELDETVLVALRREIDALEAQVLSATLPVDLKDFLVRHLGKLRLALLRYPIVGVRALEDAVESVLGGMMVATEKGAIQRWREEADIVNAFATLIGNVWTAVATAYNVTPLLPGAVSTISRLLGGAG